MKRSDRIIPVLSVFAALILLGFGSSGKASALSSSASDVDISWVNLNPGTIVSYVTYEGRSLSGMTYDEAYSLITGPIRNMLRAEYRVESELHAQNIVSATAEELGISYNDDSITSALSAAVMQEGDLLTRYKKAKDYQSNPVRVDAGIKMDVAYIKSYFENVVNTWPTAPTEAAFTVNNGQVIITRPSADGYSCSVSDGISRLILDLDNLTIPNSLVYYIGLQEEITHPTLTTERVSALRIIGEYTTHYTPPEDDEILHNREQNLIVSTSNMNGHIFYPGEVVSALSMYGEVSYANGYKDAGTIINGQHEDAIGGGICQTTTTLYNAVLMAELDVVYRRHHSMIVSYVFPSRDAMVYAASGSDFRFRNSSSDLIYIESFVNTEDQSLTVRLIGHEDHPADHYVWYESEIITASVQEAKLEVDYTLPVGWTTKNKMYLKDNTGASPDIKSRLWKYTQDGGVVTKTLFTDTDTYKGAPATVVTSPDAYAVMYLRQEVAADGDDWFIDTDGYFLSGTPFSQNPMEWSDEELSAFNDTMAEFGKSYGFTWPDKGISISVDGNVIFDRNPEPEPEPEPESESSETEEAGTGGTEETGTENEGGAASEESDGAAESGEGTAEE